MGQQNVHLYVFDTLSDWEFGYAAAGINNPAFQACPGQYRIQTVAVRREPVTTMGGLRVLPDLVLSDLEPAMSAMLILPGGVSWDQGLNTEAVEKARAFYDSPEYCRARQARAGAAVMRMVVVEGV